MLLSFPPDIVVGVLDLLPTGVVRELAGLELAVVRELARRRLYARVEVGREVGEILAGDLAMLFGCLQRHLQSPTSRHIQVLSVEVHTLERFDCLVALASELYTKCTQVRIYIEDLRAEELEAIGPQLATLTAVTTLLCRMHPTEMPVVFPWGTFALPPVHYLDLSGNKHPGAKFSSVVLPASLASLNLSMTGLEKVVDMPLLPQGLTKLDLSNNRLVLVKDLPARLPRSLRYLNLSFNGIILVDPEDIGALPSGIRHINLSCNPLEYIGEALARLANLEDLRLLNATTSANWRDMAPLAPSASVVVFTDPSASNAPTSVVRKWPTTATDMFLGSNLFGLIPPRLFASYLRLQYLHIGGNRLRQIDRVVLPPTLELLDVSHNMLTAVPPTVGTLPNLRKLVLDGNPIAAIDDYQFAAGLGVLWMNEMPVKTVHALLRDCARLWELRITKSAVPIADICAVLPPLLRHLDVSGNGDEVDWTKVQLPPTLRSLGIREIPTTGLELPPLLTRLDVTGALPLPLTFPMTLGLLVVSLEDYDAENMADIVKQHAPRLVVSRIPFWRWY